MKEAIVLLLHRLGLRATLHGFHYLTCALLLVLEDESYLLGLTKRLYPAVAKAQCASPSRVEHSLRTLVDGFWERGNVHILEELVGYPLLHKPYVGEFIDILAAYLRTLPGFPAPGPSEPAAFPAEARNLGEAD